MWPGTLKDMIDHLIAGYSTGLVVLIDTITSSGLNSGLLTNPNPKKERCENGLKCLNWLTCTSVKPLLKLLGKLFQNSHITSTLSYIKRCQMLEDTEWIPTHKRVKQR